MQHIQYYSMNRYISSWLVFSKGNGMHYFRETLTNRLFQCRREILEWHQTGCATETHPILQFISQGREAQCLGFQSSSVHRSLNRSSCPLSNTMWVNDVSTMFPGGPTIPRVLPWQQVSRVVIWSHLKRIAATWVPRLRNGKRAADSGKLHIHR